MKVKDLYSVISPYLDIQIGDSKLDTPLTSKSYLADSDCDVESYEDYDIDEEEFKDEIEFALSEYAGM